jgi:hypothetical protein
MFDINNYSDENFIFKNNKNNYYLTYKNKKIQFYLKKNLTITGITEYYNKENILVKIEKEYLNFLEKIEKIFIEKYNIDKKDFISLIKKNEKGGILKLKIKKIKNKRYIEVFDKNNNIILPESLEKNMKVKCLVEIDRFWNYNDKYGYIIIVKKINIH